jgi:phage/plasmid-associated DNA primase
MEKNEEVGRFVKVTKKPIRDKSKKIVDWEESQSLHTHAVCSDYLVVLLKNIFAYDYNFEKWYFFDSFWRKTEPGEYRSFFKKIFREETTVPGKEFGYQVSFFRGVIELTEIDGNCKLPIVPKKFINFNNGVVNIEIIGERGCLMDATPENSQRWQIPFDYIPTSWPNFFICWLDDVLGDPDLVRYTRALINAIIKRRYDLQFFSYFYGDTGRNGKGTLVRIIQALVADDDQVNTSMKILGDNIYEFGRLLGVSLVHFGEEKSFNNLQPLKQITGRDRITSRSKHSNNYIEGVCECQTLIVSNSYMSLPQDDAGPIAGRIRTIHFKRQFSKIAQKKWIAEGGESKLFAELSGIVNWALSMPDDEVTDAIMIQCPAMIQANLEAEVAGNGITAWINEYICHAEGAKTFIGSGKEALRNGVRRFGNDPDNDEQHKLYPNYLAYCRDERLLNPLSSRKFSSAVIATCNRIFDVTDVVKGKRLKDGYTIKNIRFKTEIELMNR